MECSGNNCLFSLSKKFSTRALPQIYAVVRGHPPITLCNKLPSRREREREKWLVPCQQGKFSKYLQESSKLAHVERAEIFRVHICCSQWRGTELRKAYCVPSQETALEMGLDQLTSLMPHADSLDIRCLYGAWQQSNHNLVLAESSDKSVGPTQDSVWLIKRAVHMLCTPDSQAVLTLWGKCKCLVWIPF